MKILLKITRAFLRFLSAPCFAFLFLLTANAQNGPTGRPNVLLIVADDLGFSDLGSYGGEIETPNLDRLANNGVRMTRFYSTGRCCPSRASILTGLYSHRAGLGYMVVDLGQPGYQGRLADDAVTIGEALQRSDYRTFISGKWHLGGNGPTERGFEEFYGTMVSAQTFWDPDHYRRMPAGRERREYEEGEFYGTTALVDHAIDFLDMARQTPDRPWFLYQAFNAPHFPLQAPEEAIAKYADVYKVGWDVIREQRIARQKVLGIIPQDTQLTPRSEYWNWLETVNSQNPAWDGLDAERQADLARRMAIFAAMIDVMDQNIGRLIANLEEHGELENTLIIFISDNGACAEWDPYGFDGRTGPDNVLYTGDEIEQMGQDGTYHSVGSGWANASNTPWRMYKHYNHEGGISGPFIAHWPAGIEREGVIDDRPAHLVDLMPTILAATGATYPGEFQGRPTAPLAGESILPLMRGGPVDERTFYFEHEGNRAIADGEWKLAAIRNQQWELYNIEKDRTELNNLAEEHPDIVARLDEKWNEWARENFVTPLPGNYRVPYLP